MMNFLHNVFNINLSTPFWGKLADIYLNKFANKPLELASVLFLVPNRRACQTLTSAFIRKQGLKPTILPQIIPIADIDDDELFFHNFKQTNYPVLKQPISREERLFLFAKLIISKPNEFGLKQISLAQATSLAIELGNLIDTACNQGLSFDKLQDLVPEKYATHWQETLKLLKIITQYWPQILEERQAIDACELKQQIIREQSLAWQNEPPKTPIIVAGVTASFPAIIQLLKTVKNLPLGEIYFSGIDYFADDAYWAAIDDSHPQFELKRLLSLLDFDRHLIKDISSLSNKDRELLISEIMRPAIVSDKWRNLNNTINISLALEGISLINCKTQRDEATAIALKMREILNIPEKTVALVTYDRNLARRVSAELERFDIKADDSAGLPLSLSSLGIFLRLVAESAEDLSSKIKFISLLKHPYTLFHLSSADFRQKTYDYDLSLRNLKKTPSLSNTFAQNLLDCLKDFAEALALPQIEFSRLLEIHIKTAETLATSDNESGAKLLWRGEAGKCATAFLSKLLEAAPVLGKISGKDYLPLFIELANLETVRSSYGTHPRISILGPIEARLNHFDYIILGELNEGIWPKPTQADMWMSRPMKQDFGFDLPEKNIGILGADLCGFLAMKNVILTRAERVDGTPTKKSRWLLRLETVLKALNSDIKSISDSGFSSFANHIDDAYVYTPIKAPAPCPPLYARPRKLSASGVDLLVQDPYSVFAKYILKLSPLDELDTSLDARDYGTLIHMIIEKFNNLYPSNLPDNALDILLNIGKECFQNQHIDNEYEAFWFPRFITTAKWILEQEKTSRAEIKKIYNEIEGELCYNLPNGKFTFTAKADRIDALKDGSICIIDYKTGSIPTNNQVLSGHALQLSLEGLIALKGGFSNLSSASVSKLIYWQLGKSSLELSKDIDDLLIKCEDYLLRLVSAFDFETTPYHSRPVPKFIPKNKDYEHLARIKEWSVQEDGGDSD